MQLGQELHQPVGRGQTGTAHTFKVRAKDAAGNAGAAATYAWTVDTTLPVATISSKPPTPSAATSAIFGFSANEAATFNCQLDGSTWAPCTSPDTLTGLSNGSHTFYVYATDTAGNIGSSVGYSWTVNHSGPKVTQTPPAGWTVDYFPFAFSGPVSNPTSYECSYNGATFAKCASPATQTGATYGAKNSFAVRWVDAAGERSATTTVQWTPNQGLVLYYPFDHDFKNRSVLAPYYDHDGTEAPSVAATPAAGEGTTVEASIPCASCVADDSVLLREGSRACSRRPGSRWSARPATPRSCC